MVYLITDEEKASFKRLTRDEERYEFIESILVTTRSVSRTRSRTSFAMNTTGALLIQMSDFMRRSQDGKPIGDGFTSPGAAGSDRIASFRRRQIRSFRDLAISGRVGFPSNV